MPTAQRVLTAVVGQSCTSAILILALSGIFMPNHVRAQSETSFAERYALAEDRDKVLLELIPGTEDYFYYHCLHYQTTGRIAEARGQLDAWIAKFGITANAKRMQTRQMLFEYSNNQQATLDFLIREYGINVYHVPPQKDEAAQLSTKLDSAALNWIEMLRQTAKSNGGVNLLEDAVLSKLLNAIGDSPDIRVWLSRIHRADTPGLVDAIGRELKMKDSQGFGWAPIHHELTLQQMIELRKRIPTLEQSGVFVNDYLRRIRPSDDETIRSNDTKRKHLERLEEFVSTLPEVHNSLIASVLYHRLLLDAESGTMDRKRFVRYLQMPSSRPYLSADYARTLNNKVHVDFNANYENETGQRPIGDDRALTLRYLEHFYTTDADVGEFARYLDRDYLTQVFATTKILYGVGDPKTYYAQLSPEAQKELANRVELKFAVSNPKQFLPSDNVRLEMDIKNVPELLVRVFRLNARNILSRQQSPINSAIDLDGLVANVERRINFAMKSDRRHRATIDLPELQGAGVWVVECLASGQRSRALVHKGHLQSIQRISDAGQILQIVNESGKPVPTAKVLLGEREFGPNELGEILIPFEGETKVKSIVLFDGNFATLEQFTHFAEAYELRSSFLVDPQAILAGTRTIALIRNSLLCSGQPIPLEDLIEPKLQVVTVDLDGVSSTQTYSNLKLSEHADHAQPLIIPPRLASISMTLSGQVQKQFDNTKVPVSSSYQFNVNEMSKTSAVNDFFLTRSAEGYQLELRGRNGEPYGRQPVQLEFKLFGLTSLINMRLATNANGIIDLGHLPWVEYFRSSAAGVAIREFKLARPSVDWPSQLHALDGKALSLPWPASSGDKMKPTDGMEISATDLARFTLVEMRGGVIVADLDSKLSFQDGALQIAGLDAGRYELTDHFSGQHVPIVVTKGTEQDRMLVGEQRTLAANSFAGLRIHDTKIAGGKLSFQLAGCDPFTRVHVIGTTFDHSAPQTAFLGSYREYQPNVLRARIPSFYMDSLKLDEEYQYVLARQIAVKFRGSLLPHPSVLLNPWELSATTNESIQAAAGDDLARMEAPASAPGMAAPSPATNAPASVVGNSHEYEFLRRGCLVLPNQRCDEQGNISIDLEQFEGLTNVTIVAVHPTISTYQRIALPNEKPLALRDRRLARSLDAKSHYVQREIVRILDAADKHDLGDASLTRVRLYTSIVSLFPLYQSLLNNDAQFEAFQVLRTWPSLSRDQKNLRYGELACHELNLFLFMHDREYFDAVVRPHLINKSPKQFMDDWLLERDLAKYAQPWQLQRLNAVERVLLTKRLESTRAGTKRWLQEYVVLNPIDPTNRARSFGASLRAGGMEGGKDFDAAAAFFAESDAPISGGYGFGRQLSLNGALGAMGGGRGASLGTENANWSLSLADEGQLMAMDKLAEQEFVTEALEEKVKQDRKSGKEAGLARRFSMRDSRSKKQEALFENLQATRRWAESQYYRVPLQNQNANLIMPNAYWREFLDSNDQSKFFSMHADLASKNVHEALMALAVLGLPLESTPPEMSFENDRVIVSKCPNAIAYVQGIVAAEPSDDPSPILVGQNIYLSATSQEPGAKPASLKSLVMGIPYRNRVVLTNPTSQPIRVQLLTQIPQGAIALEAAKTVGAIELDLPPYSTRETSNVFYFPSAGTFEQYGAQVCIADKYVAGSNSTQIQVLEKPDQIDETTWDFISAWGTNQAVLDYLSKANLIKTNLSQIGWRMADREMWEKTVALLSQNAMFNAEIWAYSLKHNSVKRVREFLDNYVPVLANLGPAIRCDLVELSPIDRYTFEHLDFRPIVAARIHMLGTKRVILNDGLAIQFQALMNILAHQKSIDSGNRLSIAYYMLIQNRIEEAVNHFEKADAAQYEGTMQYDYFAAYMDMLRGNYGKASERAEKYVEYPIPRWRDWFVQIRSHVRERERLERGDSIADVGGDQWLTDPTQRALVDGRENRLANAASTAPSLDIVREGDRVFMEYRNIGELKLNYYLMDVELLFSRNPFVQQSGDRQGLIEANQTDSIKVDSTGEVTRREWKIPDNLANKNVVVEVVAGGLVRSIPVYANSITVTLSTTLGRLNVVGKKNHAPIDGAYVKVYAKHNDGRVQFFKDGYTDLRGHFDYATLSTGDLQTTTRFAILVIHPELGAMIRESDPPNRGR